MPQSDAIPNWKHIWRAVLLTAPVCLAILLAAWVIDRWPGSAIYVVLWLITGPAQDMTRGDSDASI